MTRTQPEAMRLVLPWAVLASVNVRTNPAGWGKMRGRQFLTKQYRQRLDAARVAVADQIRGNRPRHTGKVAVSLEFYQPDQRRRDCGNYVKLLEDALTSYAYADDSQIKRLTWEDCGVDRSNPRVELVITPLPPAPEPTQEAA